MTVFWSLLALLSGCASSPYGSSKPGSEAQKSQQAAEQFVLQGRLAVKQAKEGFSASFKWVQVGTYYSVELWGTFGQGRTLIKGNSSYVEITTADGEIHRDNQPEMLMQEWLGWGVPLDVLRYWIQGYASPHEQRADYQDMPDILSGSFRQLGWLITPSRYIDIQGVSLPMKTIVMKDGFRITLLIKKARLGEVGVSLTAA
ncbi:MAG: lipoprotein insertase outer membrane protein LolB [Pseudomonadales bacterium]|nr:lipoprotein insertase outer membrane protein LolB [Pseudomonadales bacterium]